MSQQQAAVTAAAVIVPKTCPCHPAPGENSKIDVSNTQLWPKGKPIVSVAHFDETTDHLRLTRRGKLVPLLRRVCIAYTHDPVSGETRYHAAVHCEYDSQSIPSSAVVDFVRKHKAGEEQADIEDVDEEHVFEGLLSKRELSKTVREEKKIAPNLVVFKPTFHGVQRLIHRDEQARVDKIIKEYRAQVNSKKDIEEKMVMNNPLSQVTKLVGLPLHSASMKLWEKMRPADHYEPESETLPLLRRAYVKELERFLRKDMWRKRSQGTRGADPEENKTNVKSE